MRRLLPLLHRWFGLFTALFLFVSGLTGAMISFDHELDGWLNPSFYEAESGPDAPRIPSIELAARLEAEDPRLRVTFLPLELEPGHALSVFVAPRVDPATGELYELPFNQIALDPATGERQNDREWGAVAFGRENFLSFLYKLHYTMHIPDGFGVELGMYVMGFIAIVWTLDCFVSLYISFPSLKLWRRSFQISWREGGRRLLFDLHRSGGVWIWLLLLMLAVTAVSMNLGQYVRPVVNFFSPLSPNAFDAREARPETEPIEPLLSPAEIVAIAREDAAERGWTHPAAGLFYAPDYGVYGVGFYDPANDHGDGSLGNPWLYFDGRDGSPQGADIPGEGSAGDLFMQAQFPLHSGRLFGLPGRILVSLLGLAVATLSATGVMLWARKRIRRARTETLPALGELASK